jgi:hypothetical protein
MIPSATGFEINSDKGLKYYNSSSAKKSQFNVSSDGVLEAQQIGTVKNPVESVHSKSVNTEELSAKSNNNIRYASQFDGANGGEQIQAAIDAIPSDESGVVVVPPVGPDDVSGSSGAIDDWALAKNVWELGQHLVIPSHTTVVFDSCYVFLADGTDDNLLRNEAVNQGGRDSRIGIVGRGDPILDGNATNQTTYVRDASNTDARLNLGLRFVSLDYAKIEGLTWRRTNCWAQKIEDANNVSITDIEYQQDASTPNQDGLDIVGPAKEIIIDNHRGSTGDDMIAVAPNEPTAIQEAGSGVVEVVGISNITQGDSPDTGHAVRLYAHTNETHPMSKIVVDNVVGNFARAGVAVGFSKTSDPDYLRGISISNVSGRGGVNFLDSCRNITISNIESDYKHSRSSIHQNANTTITGLEVSNISQHKQTAPLVELEGTSKNVLLSQISVTAGGGDLLSISGTSTDIGLSNVQYDGSGNHLNITGSVTRPRWNGVIGGGPFEGVDLSSTTGQYVGDRAIADGATAATAGAIARWNGTNWQYHDPNGSV